jgi:hypothetical protein
MNTQLTFITFQELAKAMNLQSSVQANLPTKALLDSQGKKLAGFISFSYLCVWLICHWIFFLAGLMYPLIFTGFFFL